jgi:DNA-binding GntR family transcriptional regulator
MSIPVSQEAWSFEPIDDGVGIPRHRQIRDRLAAAIQRSVPPTDRWDGRGGRFPSDRELAERFGVSRPTVRQAMAGLVADGLLERIQGRGTFVRGPDRAERVTSSAFLEPWTAGRRGYRLSVDEVSRGPVDPRLAAWMGWPATADMVRVRRSRFIEERPAAVDYRFLPSELAAQLTAADVARASLSTYLRRQGVSLGPGQMEVGGRSASADEGRHLGVAEGDPVLVRRLRLRSSSGGLVLAGWSIYRMELTTLEFTVVM